MSKKLKTVVRKERVAVRSISMVRPTREQVMAAVEQEQKEYEESRFNTWSFPDYVGDSWGDQG